MTGERLDPEGEGGDNLRMLARLLMGALPDPSMDWATMVDLALQNGVAPFLYHVLRKCREQVPSDAWQVLQADYYAAVARSLTRERELEQVLRALGGAGVPTVLLKGAALSSTVYPDPALRIMSDLDLWVPRDQLGIAKEALGSLGYTMRTSARRPQGLEDAFGHQTQMVSQDAGTGLVELIWSAFPGEWLRNTAQVDEASVWERSIPVDGMHAYQLAPEDAVLQTCTHYAINHQFSGLGLRPFARVARGG